jgi:hypothetical protein
VAGSALAISATRRRRWAGQSRAGADVPPFGLARQGVTTTAGARMNQSGIIAPQSRGASSSAAPSPNVIPSAGKPFCNSACNRPPVPLTRAFVRRSSRPLCRVAFNAGRATTAK